MIERIVELMKQTKEYQRFPMEAMTDKKSVYHGLSEEELAEEVFARLTGKHGEDIMEQEGLAMWTKGQAREPSQLQVNWLKPIFINSGSL